MRLCLAPMDGITDLAYRTICKELFLAFGDPDDQLMLWTEFMSAEGYVHNPKGVIKHLWTSDFEPELIAQIFGGATESLRRCAQDIAQKYAFACIEINMGCPSPSIMKCAAGSAMLQDKPKTLAILRDIATHIDIPLSIKTRVGLNQADTQAQFAFLLEASKWVHMITIHGRTYAQGHAGQVDRHFIYELKKALPDKIILGNGGIRSYTQAQELCNNLDGVMIGQSAIGNPWIFTPHQPTNEQKFTVIFHHLDLMMASEWLFQEALQTMDETLTMPTSTQLQEISEQKPRLEKSESTRHVPHEFRKYLFSYISGLDGNKAIKQQIPERKTYTQLVAGLTQYADTLSSP